MSNAGKLFLLCGKIAVGKTTYAKELALKIHGLYLSEDMILSQLFPNVIQDFDDYITYSIQIKPFFKQHIISLLNIGVSVVLDFPGNTKRQRKWFKEIIEDANSPHELIYLKASDELCLSQLQKRRVEHPERHNFDTEDVFHHVTSFFEEPHEDEGFHLTVIEKE